MDPALIKAAALMSGITSTMLGMWGGYLLGRGTEPRPWALLTYGDESPKEIAHRDMAKRLKDQGWLVTGVLPL
jgi:hypothetical protein